MKSRDHLKRIESDGEMAVAKLCFQAPAKILVQSQRGTCVQQSVRVSFFRLRRWRIHRSRYGAPVVPTMAAIPVSRKAIMSDGVDAGTRVSFLAKSVNQAILLGTPSEGIHYTACVSLRCPGFDYAPREPQKRILLGSEG